ncbi:MAG: class I SAM-dependent DNA methyltransferase [Isosphaeraceae bacterium]
MSVGSLLRSLGYDKSPHFLQGDRLAVVPGYSHIFRRASQSCSLSGVYVLAEPVPNSRTVIPAVYVCNARSVKHADEIHKHVWNQDVVPFLVVTTPQEVRLYSGFRYGDSRSSTRARPDDKGILETAIEFNQVADRLRYFHATAIDNGILWRELGSKITPERRLDWQLLNNLKNLDKKLQEKGASRAKAHSLIGKYVYIRYLRDRMIISDRKLQQWNIDIDDVFGREAKINALHELVGQVEGWLNGSIFPLTLDPLSAEDTQYLRLVASTFKGDEPNGQMYLTFTAYDFSYIPIETLSVIYEQFMHSTGGGRDVGAYYTPLPIVNFMLEELDDRKPLNDGMKVFDPACGSGAFLVQCYRRLIEREIGTQGAIPTPERLRDLLTANIYGMDQDADACAVAELSLILTLLDYVNPPDLHEDENFKLPQMRKSNIFHANFFDEQPPWDDSKDPLHFQWVVGNPPWKEVDKKKIKPVEVPAVKWMEAHRKEFPIGRLQLAEAFAWKCTWHTDPECLFALLLPATTLFKTDAHRFRREFFSRLDVWCVVNFSNLRHILFREAIEPAAAFFYSKCLDLKRKFSSNQTVVTYSPMLANQEAGRYSETGRAKEMWAIVVNSGEIQHVPVSEAATGGGMPWKLAMWGTARDRRLIRVLSKQFPSLDAFLTTNGLNRKQGVQLRHKSSKEAKRYYEELVGKHKLDVNVIKEYRHLFSFPPEATKDTIIEEWAYLRERGTNPLPACRPPHVIVSAAGRFAVFSNEFLAYPHPHIGIAGEQDQATLLKALSLYLSSNFATYYGFFATALWGVERDRIELKPLLKIPVPIGNLKQSELARWADFHASLAAIPPVPPQRAVQRTRPKNEASLFPELEESGEEIKRAELLEQLNTLVYESLKIAPNERWIIEDFVQTKIKLNDGQLGDEAVRMPEIEELSAYCDVICSEMDAFVEAEPGQGHQTVVVYDDLSAMVQVDRPEHGTGNSAHVILRAGDAASREFEKFCSNLLAERGHWFYFNRSLRIYKGTSAFLFKPMQRMHWLRSQALADASLIVAETINSLGG